MGSLVTPSADEVFEALLAETQAAVGARRKGAALEELIAVAFARVPGVSVRFRNIYSRAGSQEIDVVLWNDQHPSGFWFLPPILFAEAKNWTAPVGSAEVAWFDAKLESGGQTAGFLVTANGITGDARARTDAYDVLFRATARGRRLILLQAAELAALADPAALCDLIKERLCRLAVQTAPFT